MDGRVIRFDSMSKIISAGIRLGYVTGPRQLLQQIMLHNQVSVMHTPTFCQVKIKISYHRQVEINSLRCLRVDYNVGTTQTMG